MRSAALSGSDDADPNIDGGNGCTGGGGAVSVLVASSAPSVIFET